MTRDKLGRERKPSQGGAGPKHLPNATGGRQTGAFTEADRPHGQGDDAREFWDKASECMGKMGTLERADALVLEIGSNNWARMRNARRTLDEEGEFAPARGGGNGRHPASITLAEAEKMVLKILSECGLTATARAKFGAPEESDPFADLIAGMDN